MWVDSTHIARIKNGDQGNERDAWLLSKRDTDDLTQ